MEQDMISRVSQVLAELGIAEDRLEAAARKVLDAMREPTTEMADRGQHVNSEWLNDQAPLGERRYREPAIAVWKRMIDAALGIR